MKLKPIRLTWRVEVFLLSLMALVVLPILTGWIADIAKSWWLGKQDWAGGDPAIVFIGCIVLVGAALFLVLRIGSALLRVHISKIDNVPAHAALITLLSDQSGLSKGGDGRWKCGAEVLPATLEEVCNAPKIADFKWQQNLRAARHHKRKGKLKWVCLVGSSGASGLAATLDLAKQLFEHYLPGVTIVAPLRDGLAPDFENLEQTRDALRKMIDDSGYADRDIVIDITGGQKTASVAAALVTLDRHDLMFQYVGTQEHAGKIFGFEAKTIQRNAT